MFVIVALKDQNQGDYSFFAMNGDSISTAQPRPKRSNNSDDDDNGLRIEGLS